MSVLRTGPTHELEYFLHVRIKITEMHEKIIMNLLMLKGQNEITNLLVLIDMAIIHNQAKNVNFLKTH